MMYAVGKGVQQDYTEAAKWFLTAAEAGNPRAAANFVCRVTEPARRRRTSVALGQVPVGPPGILSRSWTIKDTTAMKSMDRSSRYLAAVLTVAGCCTPALRAAGVTQLKDEAGKTIVEYIVEAPANVAPAGTTDPARQVGVIFCFQEHGNPTGADLLPGSRVPQAAGIERQLHTSGRSFARSRRENGARGSSCVLEAAQLGGEELSGQSPPRLHVRQRRGRQDFGRVRRHASRCGHRSHLL